MGASTAAAKLLVVDLVNSVHKVLVEHVKPVLAHGEGAWDVVGGISLETVGESLEAMGDG